MITKKEKHEIFNRSESINDFVRKVWLIELDNDEEESLVSTLARDWYRFDKLKKESKKEFNLDMFHLNQRLIVLDLIKFNEGSKKNHLTRENMKKYVSVEGNILDEFFEVNEEVLKK